ARSRDQPSTLRPVSTTSLAAMKRSNDSRPYRSAGSAYSPISSQKAAAYSAQPSRYPLSAERAQRELAADRVQCGVLEQAAKLQVMAGQPLVIDHAGGLQQRPVRQVGDV